MEIFTHICYFTMQPCLVKEISLQVPALIKRPFVDWSHAFTFLNKLFCVSKQLFRNFFLDFSHLITILFKEHRYSYIVFGRRSYQHIIFEPEIKPDAFTQSGNDFVFVWQFARKINKDVADRIFFMWIYIFLIQLYRSTVG